MTSVTIGKSVTSIGAHVFSNCFSIEKVEFKDTVGWECVLEHDSLNVTKISSNDIADAGIARSYLRDTYSKCYWHRTKV